MSPFSASSSASREEGKMRLHLGALFPSLFELFWTFWCHLGRHEFVNWMGWASFWVWAWLMAESHFFSYSCYRRPLGLTSFGPLANFLAFGFGLLWTEKMASTISKYILWFLQRDRIGILWITNHFFKIIRLYTSIIQPKKEEERRYIFRL